MTYKIKSLLYFVCFLAAIGIYELTDPEPTPDDVVVSTTIADVDFEDEPGEAVLQELVQ